MKVYVVQRKRVREHKVGKEVKRSITYAAVSREFFGEHGRETAEQFRKIAAASPQNRKQYGATDEVDEFSVVSVREVSDV